VTERNGPGLGDRVENCYAPLSLSAMIDSAMVNSALLASAMIIAFSPFLLLADQSQ
jgi:hypothetical protein